MPCCLPRHKVIDFQNYRGWIEKTEIKPFGYIEKDKEMLMVAKKNKKANRIKEVKKGYKYACDLAHIDATVALAAIFKVF